MKIGMMLLVLILMIFTGSLSFGKNTPQDLILTVVTDKNLYVRGEAIECTLMLSNASETNLTVNKRLLLNYDITFPHEILFDILAPDGKLLKLIPIIKASSPEPQDFTILTPSKFILKTLKLDRYFSFIEEGKYYIQAVYENYYQPEGKAVWTGSISSNRIEIKVTE